MVLIVGGTGSGKRTFAMQYFKLCEEDIAVATLDEKPVVCNVHELVHSYTQDELLPWLLQKQVVLCNEVGSGIVPIEETGRAWRENVGRLCCILAREADLVIRMCCGVPTVVKGSL